MANIPKFRHRTPPPNPDVILQRLTDSTKEFEDVVGRVRDDTIESTGIMVHGIALGLPVVDNNIRVTSNQVRSLDIKQDRRDVEYKRGYEYLCSMVRKVLARTGEIAERENSSAIAERENALQAHQIGARNQFLQLLRESKSRSPFYDE